jgi:hypothetical protein
MAACLAFPVLADEPGRLELRVRDSRTGAKVDARLRWQSLAAGRQLVRVESEGYLPLEAPFEPAPGSVLPVTLWLDPVAGTGAADAPLVRPGISRFEGRVFDARTGLALAGARIALHASGIAAVSDAEGAFTLEVRAPAADELSALPATDDLVVSAKGHVTQVRPGSSSSKA